MPRSARSLERLYIIPHSFQNCKSFFKISQIFLLAAQTGHFMGKRCAKTKPGNAFRFYPLHWRIKGHPKTKAPQAAGGVAQIRHFAERDVQNTGQTISSEKIPRKGGIWGMLIPVRSGLFPIIFQSSSRPDLHIRANQAQTGLECPAPDQSFPYFHRKDRISVMTQQLILAMRRTPSFCSSSRSSKVVGGSSSTWSIMSP